MREEARTIEQVKAAEESVVDCEKYRIITVLEQNGLKAGKEAVIAYTKDEQKALCFYIEHLRPKLAANQFNPFAADGTQKFFEYRRKFFIWKGRVAQILMSDVTMRR